MKNILSWKILLFLIFLLNSLAFAQLSAIIRGSVVEDANPGDIIQAKITIMNPIDTAVAARLYIADYQNNIAGERFLDADTTVRSNASWVSFSGEEQEIAPHTTVEIPVEIAVPANSNVEGSYWSMIMVEAQAQTVVEADPEKEGIAGLGLEIVNRHALNIITTVGNGYADLSFSNPQLLESELGGNLFSVETENLGNRIATADVYLDIYSMEGQLLGRIDAGKVRIRPDNPMGFIFDFANVSNFVEETNTVGTETVALESGTYNTLMIVDAGGDELFGARYTLELEQ